MVKPTDISLLPEFSGSPPDCMTIAHFQRVLRLGAVGLILSCLSVPAAAAEFNGRLTSEVYAWTSEFQQHVRPYQSVRGNLVTWRGDNGRRVSFHTYSRWTTDLADARPDDPQMFVYDAYLKYTRILKGTDLYVGRQYVYSGAGSALIDGVRIRHGASQRLRVDLFGGSTIDRLKPDQVRSFKNHSALGGRLAYRIRPATQASLSWMFRESDGHVSYRRLSADFRQQLDILRLYGRVGYNPENKKLAEILVRASVRTRRWYVSGEYLKREPSVSASSVFSLIGADRYQELRAEISRTVLGDLAIVVFYQVDLFTEENTRRSSIALRSGLFSLAWNHQNGYGGDNNGASGWLSLPLNDRVNLFGQVSLNRYRVQPEQKDRSDAYATSLGLSKRFDGGYEVSGQWQYLRNAVQSSDSRLHLRVTKSFSSGR